MCANPMAHHTTFHQFLIGPFHLLFTHRGTIEAFVRRDIRGRYAASVLGLSWAVVQPLALLALYTFVFAYILRIRLGGSSSSASFAVYLICGMLPWLAFAEGLGRSATVILEHTHLIKKVVFPAEILPAYVVVSAFVMQLVGLGLLLTGVGLFYRSPGWALTLLPVVIALQFLLTVGLGWFLASLNVFLRDVGQALGLLLTVWLFLTPILYPAELVPDRFRWLLVLNPMYHAVEAYRRVVLEAQPPGAVHLAVLAATALPAFLAGHWFFHRSKHAFVDVL
jgi:lipopolysaccharide transport system permease protein